MSEPYRMSEEEGRILEELAQMRVDDPQGYQGLLQDLRTAGEEETARRHGQALLSQIQASRDRGDDILQLISQAYKDREAEGNQQ